MKKKKAKARLKQISKQDLNIALNWDLDTWLTYNGVPIYSLLLWQPTWMATIALPIHAPAVTQLCMCLNSESELAETSTHV